MNRLNAATIAAASIVLLFIASSAVVAHESEPFSSPEPAVTEITTVLTAYAREVAKSNIEGMAAYVIQSETFSIIEGSHANWGWVDYRDSHLRPEFESDNFKITAYGYSDIRVSVAGQVAYATFNSRIEYVYDGEAKSRDGMGTVILVKTGNGWRIRHMHS